MMTMVGVPLAARERAAERLDRFLLFTQCSRLKAVIASVNEDWQDIGLTEDAVRRAVTSRLRSARLFDDSAIPYLYVDINLAGPAFSVDLDLNKPVWDPFSDLMFPATTWHKGLTGAHGRDSGFVIRALAELMDYFIDEYLRVNGQAC